MTYLVHAALGGQVEPADYGVSGAWAGLRTTSACVIFFTEESFPDRRALFFTGGQTLQINDITNFQQGYAVPKYTNLRRDRTAGGDEFFQIRITPFFAWRRYILLSPKRACSAEQETGLMLPAF
ncbi:MAG: hypothetical protein ACI81P_002968 [Neolewinella sp.]|jgi:hypothetical protein